jgi:hypothetical protein
MAAGLCNTCNHEKKQHAGSDYNGICYTPGCECKGYQYDHDAEDQRMAREGHWYTR